MKFFLVILMSLVVFSCGDDAKATESSIDLEQQTIGYLKRNSTGTFDYFSLQHTSQDSQSNPDQIQISKNDNYYMKAKNYYSSSSTKQKIAIVSAAAAIAATGGYLLYSYGAFSGLAASFGWGGSAVTADVAGAAFELDMAARLAALGGSGLSAAELASVSVQQEVSAATLSAFMALIVPTRELGEKVPVSVVN